MRCLETKKFQNYSEQIKSSRLDFQLMNGVSLPKNRTVQVLGKNPAMGSDIMDGFMQSVVSEKPKSKFKQSSTVWSNYSADQSEQSQG